MSGRFIFIGTHTLKEGKLEDYRLYLKELVELVETKEPRLIAFNVYFSEDGSKVTGVQVHPDAASMEFHMQVVGDHIREAYKFLEKTDSIEIYGTPGDGMVEMMRQVAGPGVPVTVKPNHGGGFARSSAAG